MPDVASESARRRRKGRVHPQTAEGAAAPGVRRGQFPDLSGLTIGTWRILYEAEGEEKPFCMCRCVRCGVKKIITVRKFLRGYALRCPECRIRQVFDGG
jgi:hypothetical protein